MAEPVPLFSTAQVSPQRFAHAQHRLFTGHNLHIGTSNIVHALDWMPWLGTLTLPGPACRQGYAGTGARGELRPTREPVTCLRCHHLHEPDEQSPPEQPALFAVPNSPQRSR